MSDQAIRLTEALSDRYRIEREVGAGGMATVYLAEDLKHGRPVALKVLKSEIAAVVGAERFLKEIEVTARLQHPNILPLYDSGEADGLLFYVMPFVEGESLRQRLERERQLPVEDAVDITRSVAAALQYAHERGVVHRDIKPENILLSSQALVADFGIALALRHADGGRLTETGLSLGTPRYMSPEQVTGDREIDARSDVFSLGAVAYEMLAGEPPHTGSSAQAILAKILTEPPSPISRSRALVPSNVDAAIQVALARAPADRFPSAQRFASALDDPSFALPTAARAPARRGWLWPAATMVLAAALAWSLVDRPATPRRVVRAPLSLLEGQGTGAPGSGLDFAPDGSFFVYPGPAESGSMLWLRRLDAAEARAIPGTEGATGPRVSPDGTRVSFAVYTGVWTLKIVSLTDESVTEVTDVLGASVAPWTTDDRFYFQGAGGLWSVQADGSGLAQATVADTAAGEGTHARPYVLPGDRGVLFNTTGTNQLGVLDLRTGTSKLLGIEGGFPIYASSGDLLYRNAGGEEAFFAVPFDVAGLEVTGEPLRLPFAPRSGHFGALDVAVSGDGTLLYVSTERQRRETVWVARDGSVRPLNLGVEGPMVSPRMDPEGTALVGIVESGGKPIVAVKPLDGRPLQPIAFDVAEPGAPTWHPEGTSVALTDARHQLIVPLDGRAPRPVAEGIDAAGAVWSPDGAWVVVQSTSLGALPQLYILSALPDSIPRLLIGSGERETSPAISADGRYLAYVHGEPGEGQVLVRPFPDVENGRVQVTVDGGYSPAWSSDGTDLFYRDRTGQLIAAHADTTDGFRVMSVEPLSFGSEYEASTSWRRYDVHPDGERFVMIRQEGDELILVDNWFEELRGLFEAR